MRDFQFDLELGISISEIPSDNVKDDENFQFRIDCQWVNADEKRTKYNYFAGEEIAVTYFPAEESKVALGDSEAMKDPFSQVIKERGKFSISQYIRPEERDTLTGPFPSSGGSVYSFTFATNATHPYRYIEFEEKVPNTFCFASRPVSKNGSNSEPVYLHFDSVWSHRISWGSSLDDNSAPKDASYYSPLIFTFGFLLLAICWIYAMKSFDIFTERLVLYFIAFGFGVWRPTRGNLVSGGTILLLIPVVFHTVHKLINWKFWIHETSFYLIDEFLNDSSNNLIWMYAIYHLYQAFTSGSCMKSKQSVRLVRHSLFYCVGMITLRPFVLSYFTTNSSWRPACIAPGIEDFIYWIIRYGAEVLIPCYIWRPSHNELVCYNEEEYIESK
ncbi:hypothetical protein SPOG_02283 [Schizosaccharomyces cryophilus OY26]|uniref:Uncharacterized protein n=1 Tax=Schizosaccharomyces cryophilus (strain OY26 / ATCC MYA-4695 / CBS 11777 / NBRC 106824 / NRRL Y48691) TaxID=653667 RepID=S9VY06_SCHCR|nr:uncharacterized protein SPOG_02283 [Schizosaccharomyces cryophilus OY26]EPY51104.1 hypothetical protein SPOG_02283 [Schizosaccharomyces cryophilus OY26]